MSDFFNPYAFVPPWPRRGEVPALRDMPPERLGRLHEGRWSGRLRLRITTATPILITEQSRDAQGLAERGTRTVAGRPLLASSSVKGSVRSEFEAVTGSRYGVFEGHGRRLGYRSSTRDSSDLVPVRIIAVAGDKRVLRLDGMPPAVDTHLTVLKAAWVPRYGHRPISPWPAEIVHGSKCNAWVVLMRRESWDGRNNRWVENFLYWRVLALWSEGAVPRDKPGTENESPQGPQRSPNPTRRHLVEDPVPVHVGGFYVHTNRSIGNKHDERLFFHPALLPGSGTRLRPPIALNDKVVKGWSDLLASYHAAHTEEDIHQRRRADGSVADASEYLRAATPTKSDRPGWSWHMEPKDKELEALMELPVGTLCYAKLSRAEDQVEALYPVALSRVLDEVSPASLAERAQLVPAREHCMLSPADRVFGWVPPVGREAGRDQTRALRGRVRFSPVRTIKAEVEKINRGLAVLGAPRPTQDLFYAAETTSGNPLQTRTGEQKRDGYREGQGLRGRKVYPHQPGIDWDSRTGQQWLRHGTGLPASADEPAVDSQNARLLDWVRDGAVFEADVHVEDLEPVELGALLYVLRGRREGPQARHHKLGGGTPLGFGSVTYEVVAEESELADGTAWQDFYALDEDAPGPAATTAEQLDELCDEFVWRVAPTGRLPRHLMAYENALAGFPAGTPVRYPADPENPRSDQDRYEWFVANKGRDGQRKVLGKLDSDGLADLRLPTNPTIPQRGRARR
ncbi:MAG: TIGR03986 family type III CRISPR-associated RAMP protein [Pseudonocardiaceae bacterium]